MAVPSTVSKSLSLMFDGAFGLVCGIVVVVVVVVVVNTVAGSSQAGFANTEDLPFVKTDRIVKHTGIASRIQISADFRLVTGYSNLMSGDCAFQ